MSEELSYSIFVERYKNKKEIGTGGFSKVYKVFDQAKNHYVALKVAEVRPEMKKFTLMNEVELVNNLPHHRNIARYDSCYRFNTGLTGEMDFAVLRFYEYGNLEQFITKRDLPMDDKRLIIQGILDGISFLHKNNIIHRDLKPQNILLHREDGVWTPKITDFGLSRRASDPKMVNSQIGISWSYAAPEQVQNKQISKNVDIWALGVILYRILADELPFTGSSSEDSNDKTTQSQLELCRKIINLELPEKLNILPDPYRTMIQRCLVVDPNERIQTADELSTILNGGFVADEVDNEKTQILDRSTSDAGPKNSESSELEMHSYATDDYAIPKDNVTMVFKNPEQTKTETKASTPPEPALKKKKKKSKAPLIVVLAILIIASAGGFYWYQSNNTKTSSSSENTKPNRIGAVVKEGGDLAAFCDEVDVRIENANGNPESMEKIIADIDVELKSNPKNYLLLYRKAKLYIPSNLNNEKLFWKNIKMADADAKRRNKSEDLRAIIKRDFAEAQQVWVETKREKEVWNSLANDK